MTEAPKNVAGVWRKARAAALAGEPVSACPYRNPAWRTVWLRAYANTLQLDLFPRERPETA